MTAASHLPDMLIDQIREVFRWLLPLVLLANMQLLRSDWFHNV